MSQQALEDVHTPWTALADTRAVRISPFRGSIDAIVTVPGSKSVSNRALILAAMAEGHTVLDGLLLSDDTWWCADALRRLGALITFDGPRATIDGIGRRRPVASANLHVGSAGTVARFLPPFLAAGEAGRWRVTASQQMSRRPVGPLFDALRAGGAEIASDARASCFPATITGGSFRGGSLDMAGNVSSQFISGVLLGAAQCAEGVRLKVDGGIVQGDYVRITLDAMRHFGATVEATDDLSQFRVVPTGYRGADLVVEADASTATYFAAFAAVTGGGITLANLGRNTRQPDYGFLAVLERLGCGIERGTGHTVVVGPKVLRGGFTVDMRPLSDAALTLAALAPFADGPITITGIAHIRHHESDRIAAICKSLTALGVPVEERPDGLSITPAPPRFAVLDTYEDHRVAMSLAVLGAAGNGVELIGPACVSKTCPNFFDLIGTLGIEAALLPS